MWVGSIFTSGGRCGIIMVQNQYEQYLESKGYLQLTSIMDAIPRMLMEEIEQVKLAFNKMKELTLVKMGMGEMKNK